MGGRFFVLNRFFVRLMGKPDSFEVSEVKRDVALALLGLSDGDSDLADAEINAAYKAAMQMNHPDCYANNEYLKKRAEEQSKLINEARDVLLNGTWERESWRAPEPQASSSSKESWGHGSCGASDDAKADGRKAHNGSIPSDCPSSSKPSSSFLRKSLFAFGRGKLTVAAVVLVLVVIAMHPVEILPSKESVQGMQEQGEAVSVSLVGKGEGSATFTVTSLTSDFDVDVDISLPSDVEVGADGFVCCESGALRFDGHDDREYVFLLPRRASFFQSALADWGLAEGCYSLSGRIGEEKDVMFVSTSEDFSANFPTKPQVSDSSEGVATIKDFISSSLRSKHFTAFRYVESPNVFDAFFGQGEEVCYANLSGVVTQTLDNYSDGSEMVSEIDAYELSYGEEDGFLSVSTIAPFAISSDPSGDAVRHVHMYASAMANGDSDEWYTLVGLRDTYEEAEEALSSFRPIGEGRLWGF